MPRYALRVEYDGAGFNGWQRQGDLPTIQKVLEEAAAPLNRGEMPTATAAGRTDAGVHAEAMVVDIALALDLPASRIRDAINIRTLPHPVVVTAAALVPEDWSARFACQGRSYRYTILNRPSRPALAARQVWHVKRRLDAGAMHAAAQMLLGHHDFSAFRAASCQAKSPMRTMDVLEVVRLGELVEVRTAARSFLHHQVRNLVGTLVEIGAGRRPVTWARELLEGRDRSKAGQTAPPDGLVFVAARYDPEPDWTGDIRA
jgi:tRNA pseudouridine38-40 synthase